MIMISYDDFEVKVGMHQGSVLLLFLFADVVDVSSELAGENVLLYIHSLVWMSETIHGSFPKIKGF